MLRALRAALREAGAGVLVAFCAACPSRPLLSAMRKLNRIQLSSRHLSRITAAVRRHRRCRLLVFGLGNDSAYWHAVNRRGRTVFLEDNVGWRRAVLGRHPGLTAFAVRYTTTRPEWQALLDQPDRLRLELPAPVREGDWDVVLVDGPAGWSDSTPGRMQ